MGKVEAKNGLEAYCFQIKNQLNDEKLKDKFSEEDKTAIEEMSKDALQWLEANPEATTEEYEAKQKEVEGKFQPIIMKVYQAAGGAPGAGGMPGGMPGGVPGGGMPDMSGAGGAGPAGGVDDLD